MGPQSRYRCPARASMQRWFWALQRRARGSTRGPAWVRLVWLLRPFEGRGWPAQRSERGSEFGLELGSEGLDLTIIGASGAFLGGEGIAGSKSTQDTQSNDRTNACHGCEAVGEALERVKRLRQCRGQSVNLRNSRDRRKRSACVVCRGGPDLRLSIIVAAVCRRSLRTARACQHGGSIESRPIARWRSGRRPTC